MSLDWLALEGEKWKQQQQQDQDHTVHVHHLTMPVTHC